MSKKILKDISILIFSTLLLTFLVWLPHLLGLNNFFGLNFSNGFNTIYRNFDGLEYIVIAKSLYFPMEIAKLPQSLPAIYYAAHFPGYSLLILLFAGVLGFLKSMLFITLTFTIASVIAFYFLIKNFNLTQKPLILSLIFLVLPARWLTVHSVGSSEPVFIFFVIMTFYFFLKFEAYPKFNYILLAGVFGMLAQVTRPPGVLLFIALALYIFWETLKQNGNFFVNHLHAKIKYLPLGLMPLSLLLIFIWFQISYLDFFAYFHSGDNIHLSFPPYQVFNINQFWVGDIWLEDLIYIFILGFLAGIKLLKTEFKPLGFFVLTFLTAGILIAHRDVSRYLLPVVPFVLIAYERTLTSKEFRIVLAIVALGIYLYCQNFIIQNTAPFPELSYFD